LAEQVARAGWALALDDGRVGRFIAVKTRRILSRWCSAALQAFAAELGSNAWQVKPFERFLATGY
jgi:hypothetical protein